MMQHVVFLNEIKLPPMGRVTFARTNEQHAPVRPRPATLRSEAYMNWEKSQLLAEYTDSKPLHPADWETSMCCWTWHPPIGDVIASRGYDGADECDPEALVFSGEPEPQPLREVA